MSVSLSPSSLFFVVSMGTQRWAKDDCRTVREAGRSETAVGGGEGIAKVSSGILSPHSSVVSNGHFQAPSEESNCRQASLGRGGRAWRLCGEFCGS